MISGLSFSQHHSSSQGSPLDGLLLPVLPLLCCQRCLQTCLLPKCYSLFLIPSFCSNHVLSVKEALDSKKRQVHVCNPIHSDRFSFLPSMCLQYSPLIHCGYVPRSPTDGLKPWIVSDPVYTMFFPRYTHLFPGSPWCSHLGFQTNCCSTARHVFK